MQHRCCSPWQGAYAARLVHHDDLITLHRDDGAETCHLAPARWTARFVAEITGFQAPACPPPLLWIPSSYIYLSLARITSSSSHRYAPPFRTSSSTISSASFCAPSFVYDRNNPVRVHFSRTSYRGARRCASIRVGRHDTTLYGLKYRTFARRECLLSRIVSAMRRNFSPASEKTFARFTCRAEPGDLRHLGSTTLIRARRRESGGNVRAVSRRIGGNGDGCTRGSEHSPGSFFAEHRGMKIAIENSRRSAFREVKNPFSIPRAIRGGLSPSQYA